MLYAGIESTVAEEILRERGKSLPADDLKSLIIIATGDKEEAERAAVEKIEDDLRNNRPVEY